MPLIFSKVKETKAATRMRFRSVAETVAATRMRTSLTLEKWRQPPTTNFMNSCSKIKVGGKGEV